MEISEHHNTSYRTEKLLERVCRTNAALLRHLGYNDSEEFIVHVTDEDRTVRRDYPINNKVLAKDWCTQPTLLRAFYFLCEKTNGRLRVAISPHGLSILSNPISMQGPITPFEDADNLLRKELDVLVDYYNNISKEGMVDTEAQQAEDMPDKQSPGVQQEENAEPDPESASRLNSPVSLAAALLINELTESPAYLGSIPYKHKWIREVKHFVSGGTERDAYLDAWELVDLYTDLERPENWHNKIPAPTLFDSINWFFSNTKKGNFTLYVSEGKTRSFKIHARGHDEPIHIKSEEDLESYFISMLRDEVRSLTDKHLSEKEKSASYMKENVFHDVKDLLLALGFSNHPYVKDASQGIPRDAALDWYCNVLKEKALSYHISPFGFIIKNKQSGKVNIHDYSFIDEYLRSGITAHLSPSLLHHSSKSEKD